MPGIPLFPALYFGSVEHYALMVRAGRCLVDVGEHYERQSYRTRTTIAGANGVQALQVHIARRSGEKMPMRTVGLSYAEPWHLQHLQAIRSAYGQSPWFIHYMLGIEEVLGARHALLTGLTLATMRLACSWLGLPVPEVQQHFVERIPPGVWDLRTALHPKKPLPSDLKPVRTYPQVFADRLGPQGRLCVIDLVMNLGPGARQALLA